MKIGTVTDAYFRLNGAEEGFRRMKAHGFDCADYGNLTHTEDLMEQSDAELERHLRRDAAAAAQAGITVSQVHGPWRYPPRDGTPEERAERFDKMRRALWGTAILGSPYMVLHPLMVYGCADNGNAAENHAINLEFFARLCDEARRYGVTVCLENMPMPELSIGTPTGILQFVQELNRPEMAICLDTGHANVCKCSPGDAVRLFGRYLRVMHVHDNNGRSDQHNLPYTGTVDWADFARALRETGFDGTVSMECRACGKWRPDANVPPEIRDTMERTVAQIARSLIL